MQSIDVKGPSEGEEFDSKTIAAEPSADTNSSEAVQPAESQAPAAAEESAPASEAPAAEAPAPDDASVTPPAAVTSSAAGHKAGHMGLLRLLAEAALVVIVVALALWGFGLQSKNKDLQKQVDSLNNNPAIVEQRKTNELVNKVGALMVLPTGEQPQAALVSDANALKKQYPFFSNAQNGDEILFYFKAGKVIVYRPSTNKIVQTGPLTVSQSSTAPAPAAGTTKK